VLDRAGEVGGETSGEDSRRREKSPCLDPLVEVELRDGDGVGWTGSSFLSLLKRGMVVFVYVRGVIRYLSNDIDKFPTNK